MQSIAASAIFLASVFFSVAGRATSIQEAYDILVNLTILIYFIPYLYLFAAQVKLLPDSPRSLAALGFAATAISLALTFVPPPGSNALTYEVNLIVQAAAVMIGIGLALYAWSRRRGLSGRLAADDAEYEDQTVTWAADHADRRGSRISRIKGPRISRKTRKKRGLSWCIARP